MLCSAVVTNSVCFALLLSHSVDGMPSLTSFIEHAILSCTSHFVPDTLIDLNDSFRMTSDDLTGKSRAVLTCIAAHERFMYIPSLPLQL